MVRRLSMLLALIALAGCQAYRPARGPVPSGSVVRVRFDQPRRLTVSRGRGAGDSVRVYGVIQVEGLVRAASGDTLEVELSSVRPGAPAGTLGGRTLLVPPYRQPVDIRPRDAVTVVPVVAVLGVIVFFVVWDLLSMPRT
jgi:hypothetical protein